MDVKRNTFLDSLKGIAIIGIMLIHIFQNTETYDNMPLLLQAIIRNGDLGVEITFIVTAFLYVGKCENIRLCKKSDIAKSISHKLIRVIPLYYISLALSTIYNIMQYGHTSIAALLVSAGGMNYGFFYGKAEAAYLGARYISFLFLLWIIFPFYIKYVSSVKGQIICGVIIVTLKEINYMYYDPSLWIIDNIDYFFRGCISFIAARLIYEIIKRYTRKNSFSKREIYIIDVSLIVQIIILMLLGKVSSVLFIVLISMLILVNYQSSVFIIDNKLLAYIGRHTLGLFLFHEALDRFIAMRITRGTYFYGLVVFTASFVTTIIWDTFFEPIISKKIQQCGK